MGTVSRIVLPVIVSIWAFVWNAQAQEYLRPPFGLYWGEESPQIEKLLKGAKAKITSKNTENGLERWTVDGIIQPALKQAVFYFQEKSLVGIELQYANDDWQPEKYKTFMDKFRQKIEQRFGPGSMISRDKKPEEDVTQTLVGYEWKQDDTTLQLFYFSAETEGMAFRTVSLHYRYVPLALPPIGEDLPMEELPAAGDGTAPKDATAQMEDVLPVKKDGEKPEDIRPATGPGRSPSPAASASPEASPAAADPTPAPEAAPTPEASPAPSPEESASPTPAESPAPNAGP